MRGKVAKRLRKMARNRRLNYKRLKRYYKEWRRSEGSKEVFGEG